MPLDHSLETSEELSRLTVPKMAYPELDTDAISLVRRGVVVILLDAARQCL